MLTEFWVLNLKQPVYIYIYIYIPSECNVVGFSGLERVGEVSWHWHHRRRMATWTTFFNTRSVYQQLFLGSRRRRYIIPHALYIAAHTSSDTRPCAFITAATAFIVQHFLFGVPLNAGRFAVGLRILLYLLCTCSPLTVSGSSCQFHQHAQVRM